MADFYAVYVGSGGGGGGGSGDVVGPASSDDNGVVLFDGLTGKEIKQATGTGFVKVSSGVMQVPSATVSLTSEVSGILPVANGGTNSSTALNNNRIIVSSGSAIVEAAAITASRAIVSNASGIPIAATTTSTEIGYVNGVTSSIQTQLDAKQPTISPGSISTSTTGVTVGSGTNSTIGPNVTVDVQTANGSQPGLLSAADWTTFNGKQGAGNYITALTGNVVATGPGSATATIQSGVIVNTMISGSAAIDFSKLAPLTSANILIGSAGNVATANAVTGDISLTNTGVTAYAGTVPLNRGGTGQTTKAPAFDALSPMTTAGDLILGGASGTGTRLGIGTNSYVLGSNGTTASWVPVAPALASGADADTALTVSSARVQSVVPTADRVYTLPTTSILAGDTFTIMNQSALASGFEVTVNASGGSAVAVVYPQMTVVVTALQATPTTAAHWYVNNRPDRFQRKLLTSNISTTTTITDLTYSSLTVGRIYRVTGQCRINTNAGGDMYMYAYNSTDGSNQVGSIQRENNASVVGVIVMTYGFSFLFTATNTTLEFRSNVSGTASIEGNNTIEQTMVQVQECNNIIPTTAW